MTRSELIAKADNLIDSIVSLAGDVRCNLQSTDMGAIELEDIVMFLKQADDAVGEADDLLED